MSAANDNGAYFGLMHAMQSGVAFQPADAQMPRRVPREQTPKHLRVGVNVAMSDHAGLVALLIRKGVISEAEYFATITDAMRDEVERYRKRLAEQAGVDPEKINLK